MKEAVQEIFKSWLDEYTEDFSGVLSVTGSTGVIHQQAFGQRNRAENSPNTVETAFGIASGTKLFTGLAICKLIDSGKLSLDSKLCDILQYDLGQIDKRVTVYQLLTHTSGVGDYVDEEADDFDERHKALCTKYPTHLWQRLEYYLQMITPLEPKFEPGERFCYSNSGYILLGLVVEAVSGVSYQQFVQDEIIKPCGLASTGFYRWDSLPANAATGYVQDEDTDEWVVNTDTLPIIGGSDGGIYTCAADLDILWRAIFDGKLLSKAMTADFLKPHVTIEEDNDCIESYGLGVYVFKGGDKTFNFVVGFDTGVGFCSAYYHATKSVVSAFSNKTQFGLYPLMYSCEKLLA